MGLQFRVRGGRYRWAAAGIISLLVISVGGALLFAGRPADGVEGQLAVSRQALQRAVADPSATLRAARAVPEMDGNAVVGMKLVELQPQSVWTALGLVAGDVITTVDGEPLRGPLQVIGLPRRALDNSRVEFGIERQGVRKTLVATVIDDGEHR